LKARELVCDPIIASVEILFVETGMFSDIGVDRWSMPFPTKFRDGHSKNKFMYEGIVIRDRGPKFNWISIKMFHVITSLPYLKFRLYAGLTTWMIESSKNDANSLGEIIFPPGQPVEEGCQDGQLNHEVHVIKIVVELQQEGGSQRWAI
jgi:hypothetical protein